MDKYFKLPTGYTCLQRNGDQVYAYTQNNTVRDTYELDNFEYLKIASSTNNYGYSVGTCLPSTVSHLIPASISGYVFLSVTIVISVLVIGLFNVFKR